MFEKRICKQHHLLILSFVLCNLLLCAKPAISQQLQSDNGDGTYRNPVIAADFPDPDVIRVDDTYYMVSTTMFIFPGVTILKSKDLVNWEYCNNAVPRFDFSPCYNLDRCHRYKRGQWATSLKYNKGKFHLLFIALDEGGFHCTADKPDGEWEIQKIPRGFYDPGLFFDTDGKIYVAHGYNRISITEVDENLKAISKDSLVYEGKIKGGLEGAHVYKINEYYYIYATYGGLKGIQTVLRSKNIYGPYEERVVIRDTTHGVNYGIHQGALVQTQTGEWWTMLFVDSGPFGRFPSLQPITWENDWPVAGVSGKAVEEYRKPNVGARQAVKTLPTSDDFESKTLGMQWGWNHNPVPEKWSLTERDGFLRLHTTNVTSSFRDARNTLTQRAFSYYSDSTYTVGTTKMDISKMKDGDVAGLAIFQDPFAFIAIKKIGAKSFVTMQKNGVEIESVPIEASEVFLRATPFYGSGAAPLYGGKSVDETGKATFYFSTDGKKFKQLGSKLDMKFSMTVFTGNKFCLFNYSTIRTGGYVDFDWFDMQPVNKSEL